jgi:hypothetical protein
MKPIVTVLVPVLALAAACSSTPASNTPSGEYWRTMSTGANQFPGDNLACSARTSRLASLSGPPPENQLNRPMQKWPNASAQQIYEACMLDRGWRPAS